MPFHNLLLLSRPTDDNYLNSTIRKIVSHGISYSKIEYQESDYIKAIFNITELVTLGKADGAIILSKTGIEASIIANKFPNICASRCASSTMGMYTRAHNMSNILCLGTEMQGEITVSDIVDRWISTDFIGGRHSISIGMIREGEQHQFKRDALWDGSNDRIPYIKTAFPFKSMCIGNDHAGYEAKLLIIKQLKQFGIEVNDIGCFSTDIVRYPYYAARVDESVRRNKTDGGILICGTGVGMSISFNKFKGIRAALCNDVTSTRFSRKELDSNVLCIGGKISGPFEIEEILSTWLDTPFSGNLENLCAIESIENHQMNDTEWKPEHNV